MRGGRLFEVTEIATTGDKMPMEEMLNDTTWCSTGVLQTEALDMLQPMYGSADRCSSAPSTWTSSPSCRACGATEARERQVMRS